MKLTYWLASRLDGNTVYSIRTRTKKEAKELSTDSIIYGPVVKVEIEYKDGFDLLQRALGDEGLEP